MNKLHTQRRGKEISDITEQGKTRHLRSVSVAVMAIGADDIVNVSRV